MLKQIESQVALFIDSFLVFPILNCILTVWRKVQNFQGADYRDYYSSIIQMSIHISPSSDLHSVKRYIICSISDAALDEMGLG